MIHKTLVAANFPTVSEQFVLLNDDHYYLNDLHVDDIKDWYKGKLNENPANNRAYQKARRDTYNWLKVLGLPYLDYDGHWPNVFDKGLLISTMQGVNWQEHHYVFKSLYYNQIISMSVEMQDCKIDHSVPRAEFLRKIQGRFLFSTSDNVTNSVMIQMYFNDHLSAPSKYEST
jgi:hypothetical protein